RCASACCRCMRGSACWRRCCCCCCAWCRASRWVARCRVRGCSWPSTCRRSGSVSPAQVLDYGWRLPFLIGGVFGFFAVWLRGWLRETPVFEAMHARKELARGLPLREVFARHLPSVLLSMLVTWMLTAAIVVVILMTPSLVQSVFHIAPARA